METTEYSPFGIILSGNDGSRYDYEGKGRKGRGRENGGGGSGFPSGDADGDGKNDHTPADGCGVIASCL